MNNGNSTKAKSKMPEQNIFRLPPLPLTGFIQEFLEHNPNYLLLPPESCLPNYNSFAIIPYNSVFNHIGIYLQLLYHVSLNYFFTLVIKIIMHSMCQTIHSLCLRAENHLNDKTIPQCRPCTSGSKFLW